MLGSAPAAGGGMPSSIEHGPDSFGRSLATCRGGAALAVYCLPVYCVLCTCIECIESAYLQLCTYLLLSLSGLCGEKPWLVQASHPHRRRSR
jgi:hypothetical protein